MLMLRAERLFGIKFWFIYNENFKPNIQIYRYLGVLGGTHYFQGIRGSGTSVGFTLGQIEQNCIKPFCLNSEILFEAKEVEKVG